MYAIISGEVSVWLHSQASSHQSYNTVTFPKCLGFSHWALCKDAVVIVTLTLELNMFLVLWELRNPPGAVQTWACHSDHTEPRKCPLLRQQGGLLILTGNAWGWVTTTGAPARGPWEMEIHWCCMIKASVGNKSLHRPWTNSAQKWVLPSVLTAEQLDFHMEIIWNCFKAHW